MGCAVGSVMGFGQILTAGLFAWGAGGASFAQEACEVAHVTASDGGPFDGFGFAVAVTGDTAFIGANWDDDNGLDSGAAYVFRFDGTTWVQTQKLLASDGDSHDQFGRALAADGNVALVGAPGHLHINLGTGTVYVLGYDGSAWVEGQELIASDGALQDGFGASVSIQGDVALIGAPFDDDNGPQSGSAYIFRFDGQTSQWVQEQKLLASDATSGDFFGEAVAISGHVAVIGASGYFEILPEGFLGGAAYVFRFDPDTSQWVEEQQLLPFQVIGDTGFGEAVSISGDLTLIGAPNDSSAFAFQFDPLGAPGSQWVGKQRVVPSDGLPSDKFGKSVAIDGETAVVGAFVDDQAGFDQGAGYVFRFDGSTWVEQQTLLPEPGPWTAFFGGSVAIAGDTAVVGADGEDAGSGAAYVYAGLSGVDCNVNGLSDSCDLFYRTSQDLNGNGVPDECERLPCPWDCGGSNDGNVGILDFLALLSQWGMPGSCNFDGDGVGITDFLNLLANWGPCP